MIFDLKGKRRRMVQAVYLLLAVLMGGGLVLFGIGGGSLNGGLLDAFKSGGGSSSGNKAIQKRIDTAQRQLAANPQIGPRDLFLHWFEVALHEYRRGRRGR